MAVLTQETVKERVIKILPISNDDNIYGEKLDILIPGAINKLRIEGLDIQAKASDGTYIFNDGTDTGEDPLPGYDYCICVGYQVMKEMDFDTDMNFMTEQYITRANTLRLWILTEQQN